MSGSSTTGAVVETGLGSTGVAGAASLGRFDSRFFSSVRRNTLIVVRKALCGLQSSADRGECSQTGHEVGKVDWQLSHIACSQHGRRNALSASLLQMAHRSFAGISSWDRELNSPGQRRRSTARAIRVIRTYLMSSACASVMAKDAAILRCDPRWMRCCTRGEG